MNQSTAKIKRNVNDLKLVTWLITKYVKYTCMINNLRRYGIKIHMNDEIYELN